MKKYFVVLLLAALAGCSRSNVVELPLIAMNGYGPFGASAGGLGTVQEKGPWVATFIHPTRLPEGLTDLQYGNIQPNIYQLVYSGYHAGTITREWYDQLQQSWRWTPDTLALTKLPVRTQIIYAYGYDADSVLKVLIDANNNLDLSDDKLFVPISASDFWEKTRADSAIMADAVEVSFEAFVGDQVVQISAPYLIVYESGYDLFMGSFAHHLIAQYRGEKIAVSSDAGSLMYAHPEIALLSEEPQGENGKYADEQLYHQGEYIRLRGQTYKILGVNTNRQVLRFERVDAPKSELISTQVGYKAPAFTGEEFRSGAPLPLEGLKGKYVLVDFWATWCGPCLAEFPHLAELYAKTDRAKFEIVGIIGQSDRDAVAPTMEKHGVVWPQIFEDEQMQILRDYGVKGYPTTVLIGPDGVIVAKDLRGKELEAKILELLE